MGKLAGGFLLGLGSNINPDQNFATIVRLLLRCFEPVHLSRVLHIPPVGMNSHHYFLNAVAFIETKHTEAELKSVCNQIEIALGRDRCDPDSHLKDRPADLDILAYFPSAEDWQQRSTSSITDEYFLYPLIDELKAYLTGKTTAPALQPGTLVKTDGLTFGETATTIYRDRRAG